MACYRVLIFLFVIISFANCLPSGNITHTPRRVFKFPQNSSTAVRTPSGGWARDKNTTSRIGNGEEQFVFPEDEDKDTAPPVVVNRAKFKPKVKNQAIQACADGSTFCERVDGYPEDILENIFDNELDQFKELQGTDELRSSPITQRIDANTTNEESLCPSVEELVFPRVAKNIEDKWLLILNTGSFVQGVRIEKCQKTSDKPEQKCYFNDSFPNGYTTVCRQKFIYRKLVGVNDDGKPVKDTFVLPSCCSCMVVADGTSFRQGMLRKALRTTTTPPPKH